MRVTPECHPERERSQSDRTSRSFAEWIVRKRTRSEAKPQVFANGEYLWDLRRFLTRLLQKSHSTVIGKGRQNGNLTRIKNSSKAKQALSNPIADPATRLRACAFALFRILLSRRTLHAAKVRLRATPSAQDDTRGDTFIAPRTAARSLRHTFPHTIPRRRRWSWTWGSRQRRRSRWW